MSKKVNRRELLRMGAGASAGGLAAACGGRVALSSPEPAPSQTVKSAQTSPATITVVGRDATIPALLDYSQDWMTQTGITVEPVIVGADLGRKIMQSAVTGARLADVQLHDHNLGADLYSRGYYLEVPEAVQDAVQWDDIVPFYRDRLTGWEGRTYGIPYDGDHLMNTYRRDIMLDPTNQENFQAEYGYAMDPDTGPKTWQEHEQYAEFFTGWDWHEPGETGYGFSSMWKRGGGLFWAFISRAAAYAKHPDVPDFFFDLDTGEPLINAESFTRALTEWKSEMETYAPPGAINIQWGDNVDQFLGGRVAMLNYWPDTGKDAQDPTHSVVKGTMGFHHTPGSTEVYNPKTQAWETLPEVSYAPFLGFGGRNFSVARDAENPEACWEFVKHACSPEMTLRISLTPGSGMDPVRFSQFDPEAWVDSPFQWEPDEARAYLDAIDANMNHPNVVPDMRLPGWTQYQDALETMVSAALIGDSEPQEALDDVAAQWAVITDQLGGTDRQMQFYRDLLGA